MGTIGFRKVIAMQTATVISQGVNQSVQLPAGFHVQGDEVYVKHIGKSVLLIPKDADAWDLMATSLDQFTDDFLHDRAQPQQQTREGF